MRELTREEKKKLQAMINRHREEQDEKRRVYMEHRRVVYREKHAAGSEFTTVGRSHPHRSMYHLSVEQELKQPGGKRQKSRRRSMKLKWMQLTRRQKDDLKDKVQETARKRHRT